MVLHLVQGTRATVQKGGCKVLFRWVQEAGRTGTARLAWQAMTGAEFRAYRMAMGLSQKALAHRAMISCSAVKYWERKTGIDIKCRAVKRIAHALGIGVQPANFPQYARTRGWGVTEWGQTSGNLDVEVELKMVAWRERAALRAARLRVVCGAKTRKDTPCRNMSKPGRKRCNFHGGKSTGPRTCEGKASFRGAAREVGKVANGKALISP